MARYEKPYIVKGNIQRIGTDGQTRNVESFGRGFYCENMKRF